MDSSFEYLLETDVLQLPETPSREIRSKEDIRNEILQIRQELYQLSESLKSANNFSKGIFLLPDDILAIVLEYVNQMDTFHLALTHRRFKNACKVKLFKSIYVYDDVISRKGINVPKSLYSLFYMKYTVLGLMKLLELIKSSYYYPEYMKNILFANDRLVLVDTLNTITRKAHQCSISFLDISYMEIKKWILNHQKASVSEYHWFGNSLEAVYPTRLVTHLLVKDTERTWIENELPKFTKLKSIKLIEPPEFTVPNKIAVDELYLRSFNIRNVQNVLSGFDLHRVKRLQICCFENPLLQKLPTLAENFTSLKALEIEINTTESSWYKFIEALKTSLEEIYWIRYDYNKLATDYDKLLAHHKKSLKILSFSSIEQVGFRSGKPDFSRLPGGIHPKSHDFRAIRPRNVNLENYPLLQKIIIDGYVVSVTQTREKYLVPVEFYGKQHR